LLPISQVTQAVVDLEPPGISADRQNKPMSGSGDQKMLIIGRMLFSLSKMLLVSDFRNECRLSHHIMSFCSYSHVISILEMLVVYLPETPDILNP
jgi:hypothetical protein